MSRSPHRIRRRVVLVPLPPPPSLFPLLAALFLSLAAGRFWGEHGHRLTAQAAAAALPAAMPEFFRQAASQLAYLDPEPDRWRSDRGRDPALTGATAPEHFVDLDMIPPASRTAVFAAPNRFAYADTLQRLGLHAATVGLLPFRMLELEQLLVVDFRLWRGASTPETRSWVEARVINDAGILGHYVADGSNPAHTTIHFNGWVGENPNGYTTDKRFHSRFESEYVETHLVLADITPLVDTAPRLFPELRPAILDYLRTTNAEVQRMYALEKRESFSRETTSPEHKRFVAARLAAGAAMLRDLWWTAWVASADSTAH